MLDRNSADDNATLMRLAERLIQQQDAAVSSVSALRANLPEQGRVLTFKRAVVVDQWANLQIALKAVTQQTAPWGIRLLFLGVTLVVLGLIAWAGRALFAATDSR
jgi:hypothetical protein